MRPVWPMILAASNIQVVERAEIDESVLSLDGEKSYSPPWSLAFSCSGIRVFLGIHGCPDEHATTSLAAVSCHRWGRSGIFDLWQQRYHPCFRKMCQRIGCGPAPNARRTRRKEIVVAHISSYDGRSYRSSVPRLCSLKRNVRRR